MEYIYVKKKPTLILHNLMPKNMTLLPSSELSLISIYPSFKIFLLLFFPKTEFSDNIIYSGILSRKPLSIIFCKEQKVKFNNIWSILYRSLVLKANIEFALKVLVQKEAPLVHK